MQTEDIAAEVQRGEGSKVEFKSTLRWNIKSGKDDEEITLTVLKTVTGFLNTSGGVVLIGVTDAGSIRGIADDHFKTDDQFTLALYSYFKTAMGPESAAHVRASCHLVDDVTVCRVDCDRSPQPVFLTFAGEKDAFFIRTGPMTTKLPPSKIHLYIKEHWAQPQGTLGQDILPVIACVRTTNEPQLRTLRIRLRNAGGQQPTDLRLRAAFPKRYVRHDWQPGQKASHDAAVVAFERTNEFFADQNLFQQLYPGETTSQIVQEIHYFVEHFATIADERALIDVRSGDAPEFNRTIGVAELERLLPDEWYMVNRSGPLTPVA
jgi:Putative DNA-binding domain